MARGRLLVVFCFTYIPLFYPRERTVRILSERSCVGSYISLHGEGSLLFPVYSMPRGTV